MVVRGAGRGAGRGGGSIVTAVGVAAAVGAAQLGLGYGMDIISWTPDPGGLSSEAWIASLTWATWISATAVIMGAIVADRTGSGPAGEVAPVAPPPQRDPDAPPEPGDGPTTPAPGDRLTRVLWRLILATSAALGAGVAVALVAVPARVAEVAETATPQAVAAGYAVLGVGVGLVVAVGALAARAVAANLLATTAWLWLLAVVAVIDGVLAGRDWARVPLAFWEFTTADTWFRNILLPDAGLAVGAALVIGALAALPAARRGDHPAGVVVSGAIGPLVLATAYLLAQPDLVGADQVDLSRHLVAPYLILAGLLGSLLISAVRPRAARARPAPVDGQPVRASAPVPRPAEDEPVPARG